MRVCDSEFVLPFCWLWGEVDAVSSLSHTVPWPPPWSKIARFWGRWGGTRPLFFAFCWIHFWFPLSIRLFWRIMTCSLQAFPLPRLPVNETVCMCVLECVSVCVWCGVMCVCVLVLVCWCVCVCVWGGEGVGVIFYSDACSAITCAM